MNRHGGVFLKNLQNGLMDLEMVLADNVVVSVNLVDLVVLDALVRL